MLTQKQTQIREQYHQFAVKYIAKKKVYNHLDYFPTDLWQQMSRAQLIGLGIPPKYGGQGGKWVELTVAAEALVCGGGNLGFPMAWIIHEIVSRFFYLGFGNNQQKQTYLPNLAKGNQIACFAVSEPKTGAHPKLLKTTADIVGKTIHLNGNKSYLTNGPIADVFITIAVTGKKDGRKRFSAFIVENGITGLSITTMQLKNLHPAQHGGLRLKDCVIPSNNLIGKKGKAYEEMVVPFREIEEALILGALVGSMQYLIYETVKVIKKEKVRLDDQIAQTMGKLQGLVHASRVLTYESAALLDQEPQNPVLQSLLHEGKTICRQFHKDLAALISTFNKPTPKKIVQLMDDLIFAVSLAERVAQIKLKKMGNMLFI